MNEIETDYQTVLTNLKKKILHSQYKAVQSVNKELVLLYWDIGHTILRHQSEKGWGARIIDTLSNDLRRSFPDMKGFSVRNLKYMRRFSSVYPDRSFVQEVLAQLSWYHNITLIQQVKDPDIQITRTIPEELKSTLPNQHTISTRNLKSQSSGILKTLERKSK